MSNRDKEFTFFLTDSKDYETVIKNYIHSRKGSEAQYLLFPLEYTAPYQSFSSIREFQFETRYRPFEDSLYRHAFAVIDLSEWIGHENEEYLQIFCKFLHDYDTSFFSLEYIFTAKEADRSEIEGLYSVLSDYLCTGRIVEKRRLKEAMETTQIGRQITHRNNKGKITSIEEGVA